MPVWLHTLKVDDVFHDDDLTIEQIRDVVVDRIRKARFYDEDDYDLVEIVEELAQVDDDLYFDQVFSTFYDWADEHRVWVATS